ncbi:NAD(P)-binding protein [Macrolepiota fuliginosa MF-IS2]|uniref:NAD(P)-binding protein n=1 Tax=Macrolepiota fuliginosa MF-IS2 TaxID=1400762 RepID=A0A9P5XME1_9AGAR|nr:NAD(P)-binding protein [Macrolepiota fuliginosa MF-IS2]
MVKTKIFTIGATGYIGGSVLGRLLAHPNAHSFEITTLVRSQDKANKLKRFGVTPVVGSFSDVSLVEELAAGADIVFDAVDANNLEAAKAILRGLSKRHQATGKPPTFIHTSGTGLLADNAAGLYPTDKIWDDADADDLETLPDSAPHRDVDLAIIGADKEGYVKAYLVAPSTIYGLANGRLVQAGIANNRSMQVPALIRAALDRQRAGMIGKGVNIWPNVHIDDVADLYIAIFNATLSNPHTGHGREGYYFGENGEHTLYDVGREIGHVLVELGKSSVAEPTTFTQEEVNKYFAGSTSLGSNSRCRGNRSRAIGWWPKKTAKDLFASVKPEVEELLKHG